MTKLIIFLQIIFVLQGYAQSEKSDSAKIKIRADYKGIYTGYAQGKFGFAELGYFTSFLSNERHWGFITKYAGAEIKLHQRLLMGFKIGLTAAAMSPTPIGLNLIYYTDFQKGSLVFRPEYGIGIEKIRLTYGYNIRLVNNKFDAINTHMVLLAYYFNLKKQK